MLPPAKIDMEITPQALVLAYFTGADVNLHFSRIKVLIFSSLFCAKGVPRSSVIQDVPESEET